MTRQFVAHPYQQVMSRFLAEHKRCNLLAQMGLGKTITSMTHVSTLRALGYDEPILVLAPLRVARDTWPNELAKWDHLKGLTCAPIIGDPRQRREALHRKAHFHTCNYDNIPWLVEMLGTRRWPFRMIVADESPRLKGFRLNGGGQRSKALSHVARDTDYWINLTGTPASEGLKDLWGQQWFIDFGKRLGRTHESFMDRYFRVNPYTGVVEPMPYSEEQIYKAIADCTLAVRTKDWFPVADPIFRQVDVRLPSSAMAKYRELEKTLFTQLQCGTEIEVFNAAALSIKCMQFANGALYHGEDGEWVKAHDEKLDALESIANEWDGTPLLVGVEFKSDRTRILQRFGKRAADISTPSGEKAFRAGEVEVGIAHPKSMGHGIDGLQDVTNVLVRFGHGWSLESRDQMLERIGPVRQKQSGRDRNVFVYDIVAKDTVDEDILARHAGKMSVQDALMKAMSRRGT